MEMCAAAERRETRKAPPRAQNRHEEEPFVMEKNLVPLRRTCSAAIFSEDLASGVEQSNVVELLRGKALCRLPRTCSAAIFWETWRAEWSSRTWSSCSAGRHCADSRRTRRCTRWGSGRRRPRRSRGRREEGAAGRDSPARESRHGRLDAAPEGAADGDGHEETVAAELDAERREPSATPPTAKWKK